MLTPGTGGFPEGALPAPPGPFAGEMPVRALGSEPRLAPLLPAPVPVPFMPLPEPGPCKMPVPLPDPPRPGLVPPPGDMASDPVVAFAGRPIFVPGWLDITVPDSFPLPPVVGEVETDPVSSGAPRPGPLRPTPDPVGELPPPIEGGGGATSASERPPDTPALPPVFPVPPPFPARAGGGATTLGFPR